MRPLHAALLCFALLAPSSWAARLQPVPLSTPQATCPSCFFPQPVAVQVTDDAGNPLAGAAVTFSLAAPANAFVPRRSGPYAAVTDASGVAALPAPGLVASAAGAFTIVATSAAASGEARFELLVTGAPPATIERISYDRAVGMVGALYRDNFGVVALDASRQPVPNAAVEFVAPLDGASVTFADAAGGAEVQYAYERASAEGYAFTRGLRANATIGLGEILARALDPAVAPVFFTIANSAAGVASIEPFAPTASQATRVASFFPDFVGAVVRDAAGLPVQDAAVLFDAPYRFDAYGAFMTEENTSTMPIVFTGADGIAMSPLRVLAFTASRIPVRATVPGAEMPAAFDLTATPGPARALAVVSGAVQRAVVGTTFTDRWVLRAAGDDGAGVPYAAVFAYVSTQGAASGSFDGRRQVVVMADRDGVATLPAFTANGIEGSNYVWALTHGDATAAGGNVFLWFENLPVPFVTAAGADGPDSVARGEWAAAPFHVTLFDRSGAPAGGVAYEYSVDPACGRFAEGAVSTGVSSADGTAWSSPLQGVAASLSCPVTFRAEGLGTPVVLPVHVFAPESVVLAVAQASLEVVEHERFFGTVFASAGGLPVNIAGLQIAIGTSASGATAFLHAEAMYSLNSGRYGAAFVANDRPGSYEIRATYGGASAAMAIKQRPR
ncbi:MAG TPA: hypothetical protein VFK48_01670 [Usitatibacter sp.]|nr:hypothetical protein [Usitatibacter sp.]